jgi:mono/diheme cytochrome c family protein
MKRAPIILSILFLAACPVRADDIAAGKKIFTGKCGRCHQLYGPAKYDAKTWDAWMQKMRNKAHLNEKQFKLLNAYCQSVRATKTASK